jgi:hypothetical protein
MTKQFRNGPDFVAAHESETGRETPFFQCRVFGDDPVPETRNR